MNSDAFKFFVPVDLMKSEETEDASAPIERRIAGYASTASRDRQGDEILQKGLDISDFVDFGYFNLDHDNTKLLGHPDKAKCKVDKDGFYVEGVLWDTPLAKSLWDTALAMKKSNAPRKLGFSVEGKVLQRNEIGQVVKAKVYNVAITANPVNTTCTWDALVKSFTHDEHDFEKSLEAGYGDGNGSPLVRESLGRSIKILSSVLGDSESAIKGRQELKEELSKRGDDLTEEEMQLYLMLTKGLSLANSASLVDTLIKGGTL